MFKTKTDGFTIRERSRIQLRYAGPWEHRNSLYPLDKEFTLEFVTPDNFEALSYFNLNLDSKFWSSKEEFVKSASAVFIRDKKHNPVSICYAAAIADQKAEIDVLTVEPQRGKGLSKSLVESFVNQCTKKKIFPNWDCFEDNTPSLRLAENLKFIFNKKYKFISIFKQEKQ